ncbi:SMP-30/gluconolactonase/LRE family protein [Sphingomonas oleivorans]|nr:SMP-30/gluconolactonase/LRE family protein [Sphingomonas oleivorans]
MVEYIWPLGAALGEGPLWDARSATLWFTDIKKGRVHRLDPASGQRDTFELGGQPGFIVPSDDGGFVVGRGHELLRFDGTALDAEPLATVEMAAGNRLNDAVVDSAGRLWFGSMDDGETSPSGAVYLFDRGRLARAGGECVITNGPTVTGDGRYVYHVDTLGRTIWRFDISAGDELRDGSVFARIDPADGTPDGVTIDAEDHVWVGLWGGWQARRYAPDGSLVQTVELPCANVTKLAFGGADLKTAYVTTARIGLTPAELEAQPEAGGLFAFSVDVPGVPSGILALGGGR